MGVVGLEHLSSILFELPAETFGNAEGSSVLRIKPQAHVEQYRVDFLLTALFYEDSHTGVAVHQKQVIFECDGSDFHDATIEQLVRDRRRDRELQIAGFNVFCYSGSEVWRDVFACARETVTFLKSAVDRERRSHERKPIVREQQGGDLRSGRL